MTQRVAPDLILFGVLILMMTVPEYALVIVHVGWRTPPIWMVAHFSFGIFLIVAGIYGAATVSRRILLVQAAPAARQALLAGDIGLEEYLSVTGHAPFLKKSVGGERS